MMKLLFLEISSSLCYSNSLPIFSSVFFQSHNYEGSLMLYSLLQAISIIHLSLIQPCPQVSVLLRSFSGFL